MNVDVTNWKQFLFLSTMQPLITYRRVGVLQVKGLNSKNIKVLTTVQILANRNAVYRPINITEEKKIYIYINTYSCII